MARRGRRPSQKRLVKEYEGGATMLGLAAKYGMTQYAVRQVVLSGGAKVRRADGGRRPKLPDDPELNEALVERYQGGAPLRDLAARHGVSEATIATRLAVLGVERRPTRERAKVDVDALVAAYEAGAGLAPLAKKHGVSPELVRKRLMERGVRIRPVGGPAALPDSPEVVDALVEAYESGARLGQLAKDTGTSVGSVRRRLLDRGVKMRRAGARVSLPADEGVDEALVEAYVQGTSLRKLEADLGVNRYVLSRRLASLGIKPQKGAKKVRDAVRPAEEREANLLGEIQPVERTADLEVETLRGRTVPTLAEMARLKAWSLATSHTTRDLLSAVVVLQRLGEERAEELVTLDSLYPQPDGASPLAKAAQRLSLARPSDQPEQDLAERNPPPPWDDWDYVVEHARRWAAILARLALEGPTAGERRHQSHLDVARLGFSPAVPDRASFNLRSAEIVSRILDEGGAEDWRALFRLANRRWDVREGLRGALGSLPQDTAAFWRAALTAVDRASG